MSPSRLSASACFLQNLKTALDVSRLPWRLLRAAECHSLLPRVFQRPLPLGRGSSVEVAATE